MLAILAVVLVLFVTLIVRQLVFGIPIQLIVLSFLGFINGNKVSFILLLLLYTVIAVLKKMHIKAFFEKTFSVDFSNRNNMYSLLDNSNNTQNEIRNIISDTLNKYISINHLFTTLIEVLLVVRIFTMTFRPSQYEYYRFGIPMFIITHIVVYILILLIKHFLNKSNQYSYVVNKVFTLSKIGLFANFILILCHMCYGGSIDSILLCALFFIIYIKLIFMYIFQIRFRIQNDSDLLVNLDKIFSLLNNNVWLYDDNKINHKTAFDHSIALIDHRDSYRVHKEKTRDFDCWDFVNIAEKKKSKYYFYPIFMMKESLLSKKVYLYKDLDIENNEDVDKSYFVPSDCKVINEEYDHTNKDGSRDKRFKDNYSVKTFKIGRIVISFKNKLIFNICMTNINSYEELNKIYINLQKEYLS